MLELVSDTGRTKAKRKRRHRSSGGTDKKKRTQEGTPKFPIHPEGKPATGADAPN